jgi:hypothetical protein
MKIMKPMLAIALVSSLSIVNANAIGEREKGALIGAGAMLLLPAMVQNMGALFGTNQASYGESVQYHQNSRPIVLEQERVIIIKEPQYDRHRYNRGERKKRYRENRYEQDQQIIIIQR